MARGKGTKDKWAKLPREWRDGLESASDEKINEEIRNAALYAEKLEELKAQDPDVLRLRESLKFATTQYREGKKECNLKIKWLRAKLQERGRVLPGDV